MIPIIIATLAPIVNSIQFFPQLYKTYITKSVKDLSFFSLSLILINNLLWLRIVAGDNKCSTINIIYYLQKKGVLHLFSFKTPSERAELSEQKCTNRASSMRNGVNEKRCKKFSFFVNIRSAKTALP